MASVFENLRTVRESMAAACRRAARAEPEVELAAVIKYASLEQSAELLRTGGVRHVGESRVQDAGARKEGLGELAAGVKWRMLGHLQKNKAKKVPGIFDAVDSIDSLETAEALETACAAQGRSLQVLVQMNLAGTAAQSGVSEKDLSGLLRGLRALKRLEPRGLMMIAPNIEPVEGTRPYFRRLKTIFDGEFGRDGVLSMGMSRDFGIAIEEGSTMVRVGTLLFQ